MAPARGRNKPSAAGNRRSSGDRPRSVCRSLRLVEGVEEPVADPVEPRVRAVVVGAGARAAGPAIDRSTGRIARHADEVVGMGRMAGMARRQRDARLDPTRLAALMERLGASQPVAGAITPQREGAGEDFVDRGLRRHPIDRGLFRSERPIPQSGRDRAPLWPGSALRCVGRLRGGIRLCRRRGLGPLLRVGLGRVGLERVGLGRGRRGRDSRRGSLVFRLGSVVGRRPLPGLRLPAIGGARLRGGSLRRLGCCRARHQGPSRDPCAGARSQPSPLRYHLHAFDPPESHHRQPEPSGWSDAREGLGPGEGAESASTKAPSLPDKLCFPSPVPDAFPAPGEVKAAPRLSPWHHPIPLLPTTLHCSPRCKPGACVS